MHCKRCGFKHVLSFSGSNPMSVNDAMEEALLSEGWGVASMTCPDCYDPLIEQRAEDEAIEEWTELEEDYEDDDWEWEEDYRKEDV